MKETTLSFERERSEYLRVLSEKESMISDTNKTIESLMEELDSTREQTSATIASREREIERLVEMTKQQKESIELLEKRRQETILDLEVERSRQVDENRKMEVERSFSQTQIVSLKVCQSSIILSIYF
jgi:hypothetical protein